MKNSIKTGIIGTTFATMPLNINGNGFENYDSNLRSEEIKTSLFENLKDNESFIFDKECINYIKIDSKVITDAVINYFDEEVKKFKLSQDAKNQLTSLLNSYFAMHSVLKLGTDGTLIFEIDDKKEFTMVLKKFVNIVMNDMPFLVRKVIIPLFFGNDSIQQKLDNLDSTLMNMKEKEYKDVIFDYTAGIIKRVAMSLGGNMKIGVYYGAIDDYYPNKNAGNIRMELDRLGLTERDIKNLKYPFGK